MTFLFLKFGLLLNSLAAKQPCLASETTKELHRTLAMCQREENTEFVTKKEKPIKNV